MQRNEGIAASSLRILGAWMAARSRRTRFDTTHWSIVLAAGDTSSPEAAEALRRLCEMYWYPLYAFLRTQGRSHADAEDLTQAFFARLLEKKSLRLADRDRGRFRSFLITSLKNFAANEYDRERAEKRGGHQRTISLEIYTAEGRFQLDPPTTETPDVVFERTWALTLLDKAMQRLRQHTDQRGELSRFDELKPYLTAEEPLPSYAETGRVLGMSEGAVRVAVSRLRHRLGTFVRDEIAQTVESPDDVDAELRHLLSVLRRRSSR